MRLLAIPINRSIQKDLNSRELSQPPCILACQCRTRIKNIGCTSRRAFSTDHSRKHLSRAVRFACVSRASGKSRVKAHAAQQSVAILTALCRRYVRRLHTLLREYVTAGAHRPPFLSVSQTTRTLN